MTAAHRNSRSALLLVLALPVLPGLSGCGSGDGGTADCSGVACLNPVTITAKVPPVGNDTWSVEVCLNAFCDSVEVTALEPLANTARDRVELVQDGKLVVTGSAADPNNGDIWGVTVTDQAANIVVQGSQSVTYKDFQVNTCTTCKRASFNVP